ncbi:MAG: TIGR03619 family F420-dependent LLM class oxidoreductase [Proteobacteria bacterium]|nr:TIGR03619 family F420-dependent LLM class oxidoreductase [Pseudomonadota bacterium]
MKFWLSLVAVRETEQLAHIAGRAEQLGFHGLMVGEHLVWPQNIRTRYPYSSDGRIFVPPDTPWPDPWVLFAHLGAVAPRLHFASNIYLAALRDPLTVAKSVATAAVLTGDRVVCGVSAGWLAEEFELAGVDFATRGRRLDDTLSTLRRLWSGDFVPMGAAGSAGIMRPAPARPVRIWCGGGAPAAMRRAAQHDGWLPLPMTVQQAHVALGQMQALRRAAGRSQNSFQVALPLAEPVTRAALATLAEWGIDDLVVIAPWLPSPWDTQAWLDPGDDMSRLEVKYKALQRYAETAMSQVP